MSIRLLLSQVNDNKLVSDKLEIVT